MKVAAGQAHTLFLVDPESLDLGKLESWHPEVEVEAAPPLPAGASGAAAKGGCSTPLPFVQCWVYKVRGPAHGHRGAASLL